MSNEDKHELPPSASESVQQTAPDLSPQGVARRRFARAGVGASGVIMTLASQPGMATTVCRPPSGFLSGTWASTHPKQQVWCAGMKPEIWCAYLSKWKTLSKAYFWKYFTCTGNTSSLKDLTLFQIMSSNPAKGSKEEVAKFIVTAWLNARANLTPVLPESKVKIIWGEYTQKLSYTPDAGGATWGNTMIVDYIKSTIPGYPQFVIPSVHQ